MSLVHNCTIFFCSLDVRNIDDQCRGPNVKEKDHLDMRTPAFVVLRAINLNVENVLSLVLSLDCVSPSVWVTNGFLKKNS